MQSLRFLIKYFAHFDQLLNMLKDWRCDLKFNAILGFLRQFASR